jgi:hypothetical protein
VAEAGFFGPPAVITKTGRAGKIFKQPFERGKSFVVRMSSAENELAS